MMKTRISLVVSIAFCVTLYGGCGNGNGSCPEMGSSGGPCYGNGTCDEGLVCNEAGICEAESSNACAGIACSDHGECLVNTTGEPRCLCDEGFFPSGLECLPESNPCDGVDCSGHGECLVDTAGEPRCLCDEGFSPSGLECLPESNPCDGIDCSGHGECLVQFSGQPRCVCDEGYVAVGLECLIEAGCRGCPCQADGSCNEGLYCNTSNLCVAAEAACDFTNVTSRNSMPVPLRTVATTEAVNGKIYILGGTSNPPTGNWAYSRRVYEYDIASDSYLDLGEILPYGLNIKPYNIARADNGRFYTGPVIGTNQDGGWGNHSRIIEFDPVSGTAVEKASFGGTMWDMAAANGGDGYIYFFGAWNGGSVPNIWRYDPAADSISVVANLPKAGNSITGIIRASNGLIYAFGNQYGPQLLIFNPVDYSTRTIAQPCTSIGTIVWEAPQGILWSFCDFSTLVKFDISSETFTTIDLGEALYGSDRPDSFSVDYQSGTLFAFGGDSDTEPQIARVYRHDCLIHELQKIVFAGRSIHGAVYHQEVLWITHGPAGASDFCKIAKVDPTTGAVLAESQELQWNGRGITVAEGDLWIVDARADVVHRVDPVTFSEISHFSTPGTEPNGITYDGTNLWLLDPWFQHVYELTTSGSVVSSFSVPNAGQEGLEWDGSGMWIDTADTVLSHFLPDGTTDDQVDVTVMPAGGRIYDIAIGEGRLFVTTAGDTIFIQDWP